jgi:predicted DNA-binding transcriptional regulator YafY
MHAIEEVQQLRDQALIERLTHSVRNDRQWTVRLLVEMGEVQVRVLYRDMGFSSREADRA